jgi:uncharacterized membrane protein
MKVNKGMLIASAAAVLVLSGAVQAKAEDKAADTVKCSGVNECKGKGSCAGPESSCAGANACKGKGVVTVPKAECEKKGGKVVP